MDILKMLAELRSEKVRLEEAILVMQRLVSSHGGKRRGRPPKWMWLARTTDAAFYHPKKRTLSVAARKRIAAAQKKRWAARKTQERAA
jgi:hypothetical protein